MNRFLLAAVVAVGFTSSFAHAERAKTASDVRLEERVRSQFSGPIAPAAKNFAIDDKLQALRIFNAKMAGKIEKCTDAKRTVFAKKYVMSYDAQGNPCRIYDLSFPTLSTLFSGLNALQIPVQTYTSDDYLYWLDGNFAAVNQRAEQFKKSFDPKKVSKESWLSQLRFKNQPVRVNGMPKSFRASDLELGSNFAFAPSTRRQIQALIQETRVMKMTNSDDQLISDFWLKVLNHPETLLEGVRFDWNELDKVYDIVLEGEFLPIKGPVTLVDYQIQYKYAVEKMVRGVLETGLHQIARVIPEPMTQNIVNMVITDSFEMLETAYQYQMNQLEDTLRSGVTGRMALNVETAQANKGLNVLYGTRSDLVSAYILAIAQGKEFDWQAMDKLGQTARYNNEKAYNIKRAEMNSQLTLEKGCEMSLMHDYFGVCSLKGGNSKAVYSLISERVVYGYSFGAPLVYRYGAGYEMTLKRAGTWAMSMGLRVFDLPISSTIIEQLDSILKNYLYTGMTDEAYLRNALYMQNEPSDMLKWLYIQNLNPFLPKTAAFEQWVIDANLKGMH